MQWIKVFTNIFANLKIQLLLKERDGHVLYNMDSIINTCWAMYARRKTYDA